jgi:hypothetical protein
VRTVDEGSLREKKARPITRNVRAELVKSRKRAEYRIRPNEPRTPPCVNPGNGLGPFMLPSCVEINSLPFRWSCFTCTASLFIFLIEIHALF